MCGVSGAIALNHSSVKVKETIRMVEKLSHRGPDDAGYLYFHTGCRHRTKISFFLNLSDKRYTRYAPLIPDIQDEPVQRELARHGWDVFLGHRRLAIIDLSDAGHQPMGDLSKNIWVVYNGEIYNFPEIRASLEQRGYTFQSDSDTEIIIYSYAEWGIDSVSKFNGMFAFALYDNFKKKVYLVRDRYGIKPLYYAVFQEGNGWTLLFASEVKAILSYLQNISIDYDGLVEYFTFQNFYSDRTLWQNIKILPQGHYLEVDLNAQDKGHFFIESKHKNLISSRDLMSYAMSESSLEAKLVQYWDFDFFSAKLTDEYPKLVRSLEEIFENSVQSQLISDVEIGSYLSGGMDSGSIASIASKYFKGRGQSFKTFTIGFDLHSASGLELVFDERAKAEHMSYLFGTEHYEMVLKSGDMERCINSLVYHLEEPRVGQSYPNFYAAKLASKFVKVVLSGCGGDELFCGYPWRYYGPLNSKNFEEFINRYFPFWQRLFPEIGPDEIFAPIKGKFTSQPLDVFRELFPEEMRFTNLNPELCLEMCLYFEAKTFLHGLLVMEDKLSMAHSLETRVPFLDNELVDFAMRIPARLKLNLTNFNKIVENPEFDLRTNKGKRILRDMMKRYVPEEIAEAEKQGFSAPDKSWFRGESIELIKRLILKNDAFVYNFIDRKLVQSLVNEHLEGKVNRRLLLWSFLYFEKFEEIFSM
jgi:asparagine synthase (glutamine-hydrolysing)